MAKTRPNIVPIIEDARHPLKYRMLIGMVDTVFADVAQPDQVGPHSAIDMTGVGRQFCLYSLSAFPDAGTNHRS